MTKSVFLRNEWTNNPKLSLKFASDLSQDWESINTFLLLSWIFVYMDPSQKGFSCGWYSKFRKFPAWFLQCGGFQLNKWEKCSLFLLFCCFKSVSLVSEQGNLKLTLDYFPRCFSGCLFPVNLKHCHWELQIWLCHDVLKFGSSILLKMCVKYVGENVGSCFMPWTHTENVSDRARHCLGVRMMLIFPWLAGGEWDNENQSEVYLKVEMGKKADFSLFWWFFCGFGCGVVGFVLVVSIEKIWYKVYIFRFYSCLKPWKQRAQMVKSTF